MILHILYWALAATALRFPFKQSRSSSKLVSPTVNAVVSSSNDLGLDDVHDLLYISNVTLGGNSFPVQLDTGSSDLWIKGTSSPLPNSTQTSTTYNLTYGIGWAYGTVSYAEVVFAGISVAKQAYLDISQANNPALSYGADGILGLGFTSLSTVDALLNATGSSAGRSLLYNLFADNPSEPNFISFLLQRVTEADDTVQGSFAIGEYEPDYAAVANSTPIPTWPVSSPKRWTVLLDGVLTGGSSIVTPATTISGVPSNQAVVLMDSGTSWTYTTTAICDAIYGNVAGAYYSSSLGQWVVPCDAEIDIALQIGGQAFPVHPLDVSPVSLSNSSQCVGSFVPQSVAVGAGEFDWLIGDNFLRSVYSVYDFGDFDPNNVMGNPYLRLLSIVDPNQASSEFVAARGGVAKTNITYTAANISAAAATTSGSTTVSDDVANTLDRLSQYLPAILGVMALNALVLIALVIIGIAFLCRGRRKRARAARMRTPSGRVTPRVVDSRNSYIAGTPPAEQHVYEPISMAITEDTMFTPPSPGFRQFDGKLGDRPKSVATLPSQSKLYQQIGSDDALIPPSSAFARGDRPKSMGMNPTSDEVFSPAKDEAFTPPATNLYDPVAADNASLKSGRSGKSSSSLVDDSVAHPILSLSPENIAMPPSRPGSMYTSDRPNSIVVPSAEDSLLPPSPDYQNTGFSGNDRPRSAVIPAQQAPRYPPPQVPYSASPRFNGGSTLRPNANFGAERPLSVGMLPSQMPMRPHGAGRQPSFPRPGSSLRPVDGESSFAPQFQQQVPAEEDITTFTPPAPAFRRPPGAGSGSGDRPMSIA